jgi:hypothetical protein
VCYRGGSYVSMSKSEQREERARVQAHHVSLREALNAGEPGAQEKYDAHLALHRRSAQGHTFTEGDHRAVSIIAQDKAERRVADRKDARRAELEPDPERREAARQRRIESRAHRREAHAAIKAAESLLNRHLVGVDVG